MIFPAIASSYLRVSRCLLLCIMQKMFTCFSYINNGEQHEYLIDTSASSELAKAKIHQSSCSSGGIHSSKDLAKRRESTVQQEIKIESQQYIGLCFYV